MSDDPWSAFMITAALYNIGRNVKPNPELEAAKEQKQFVRDNSNFIIEAKRQEIRKEHFFRQNEYDYVLDCIGLPSRQRYPVKVEKEYFDSVKEGEMVRFEGCKAELSETGLLTGDYGEKQVQEECWYDVPGYRTYEIEEMIDKAKEEDSLFAFLTYDAETEKVRLCLSTQYVLNDKSIVISRLEEIPSFPLETPENNAQKEILGNYIRHGLVKMPIKELKAYKVQSRHEFCKMVNKLFSLHIWYEPFYRF